jgi:hypothetical protein
MKNNLIKLCLFVFLYINISQEVLLAQPPVLGCEPGPYTWQIDAPKITNKSIPIYSNTSTINYFDKCSENEQWAKNISFLHGLAGASSSWEKPRMWTVNNYTPHSAISPQYKGHEQHFYIAAEKFKNNLSGLLESGANEFAPDRCKKEDYVIAHSQGGIVARYLDHQWWLCENGFGCKPSLGNRNYYGVVTFAAPNAGAHIGLSKHEHYDMVSNIVNTIVLNPIDSSLFEIKDKWFVSESLATKIDLARANLDTFLKKNLAPALLAGLHSPTLDSMVPNTPIINSLTAYQSRLRRVAFYGVEDAPEVWRIMDMVMNDEPSDVPLFTANTDDKFMETVERIRIENINEIKNNEDYIKRQRTYYSIPIWGLFHELVTINGVLKEIKEKKMRQDKVDFLNNANTQWRYLIGSYHRDSFDVITVTKYIVSYIHAGFPGNIIKHEFSNENDAYNFSQDLLNSNQYWNVTTNTTTHTSTSRSFYPSDGVVLVKSQKAFPGVKESDTDIMRHNNHFQVRNSSETERVLLNLYTKENYDQFFRLKK